MTPDIESSEPAMPCNQPADSRKPTQNEPCSHNGAVIIVLLAVSSRQPLSALLRLGTAALQLLETLLSFGVSQRCHQATLAMLLCRRGTIR